MHVLLGASIYDVRTAAMGSSCSWLTSNVVRGHHVYKNVWTPSIGERLQLHQQDDNDCDDHAMSIVKAETIVSHIPREMSHTFWHFIRHGGSVGCEITEKGAGG